MFQSFVFRLLSLAMSAITLWLSAKNGLFTSGAPYAARDPGEVRLNAVLLSDIHTDGDPFRDRNVNLTALFSGVAKSRVPLDALVIAGDLTNAASRREYPNLEGMLNVYNRAKRVIPSSGNHDVGGGTSDERDYGQSMAYYYAFCRRCGIKTDTPYWQTCVNGYPFLVIGSEARLNDSAYISEAQLRWLDGALAAAVKTGKPVFVIGHQILSGTNGLDASDHGELSLGEQSDAVRELLEQYAAAGGTVLYVSGHRHKDFNPATFDNPAPGFFCLNLPSSLYSGDGGRAVAMEVYDGEILLRARNFITGEWLEENWSIPLL